MLAIACACPTPWGVIEISEIRVSGYRGVVTMDAQGAQEQVAELPLQNAAPVFRQGIANPLAE